MRDVEQNEAKNAMTNEPVSVCMFGRRAAREQHLISQVQ